SNFTSSPGCLLFSTATKFITRSRRLKKASHATLYRCSHERRDESFHALYLQHERCDRLLRPSRGVRQRQGAVRRVPAVLDCVAETSSVQIVGLSLLDRLIVTTHRAGCAPICLIAKSMPLVPRTRALGIDITLASVIPELE